MKRGEWAGLTGQVALITGASRGIGRAIAVALAEAGATVGIHYHMQREAAEHTLKSLKEGAHFLLQGDLADPDVCQSLLEQTLEMAGRLDMLINNAGIYTPLAFDETSYERWQLEWQKMFQVNFFSAVNLSYHAVGVMRHQGAGKIVHVASRAGFRGEAGYSHYAASKAALINLTRSMAVELAGEGIRVYCVAPGWVETDMAMEGLRAYGEKIRGEIPLGRVAQPEDVAAVVRFLVSPEADYLSGTTIDVNGASYFH